MSLIGPGEDTKSQSPDGDFFDPEPLEGPDNCRGEALSQSPDGDFFDPEQAPQPAPPFDVPASQSPDGDFFDPENNRISIRIVPYFVTVP